MNYWVGYENLFENNIRPHHPCVLKEALYNMIL